MVLSFMHGVRSFPICVQCPAHFIRLDIITLSNIYHVAPHYVKIFRTRSNSFSDALIPQRKCLLIHHFSAELWHALSEKQYHTRDLSALHITYALLVTNFTVLTADMITLFTKQVCDKLMIFIHFSIEKCIILCWLGATYVRS